MNSFDIAKERRNYPEIAQIDNTNESFKNMKDTMTHNIHTSN
jgi:hypothetical protein